VAIGRALVNEPRVLLADEPTGALDSRTAGEILGIFDELHRRGSTIVLVTHNREVAAVAERVIHVRDGRIHDGMA
jgi:putative ABC transport system ATP-binding protein